MNEEVYVRRCDEDLDEEVIEIFNKMHNEND